MEPPDKTRCNSLLHVSPLPPPALPPLPPLTPKLTTPRFIERDTGAKDYFSVPLSHAFSIFTTAQSLIPGTARTARGPSMSASPGKIGIVGIETINGEKVFVLKFLQARNPEWTKRLFFARWDGEATWLGDLKPAGGGEWFWEKEYRDVGRRTREGEGSSGQLFG